MAGATYLIGDAEYSSSSPQFQTALEYSHERGLRPLCLCRRPYPQMYVAKIFGHFHIKRMPNTGAEHSSNCVSFEPPAELSGLGYFRGAAIQESPDDGTTNLSLGFPFKTGGVRPPIQPSGRPSDTVKVDRSRLSLLGLLHFLWDQSGLTRWHRGLYNVRSWGLVRSRLQSALGGKVAKGELLYKRVFLPEPFEENRATEIERRRKGQLAGLIPGKGSKFRPLELLVGEVRSFTEDGHIPFLELAEAPGWHLHFPEGYMERLRNRFPVAFQMFAASGNGPRRHRLILIALFSISQAGEASIHEASLMIVDDQWIPISDALEDTLLQHLYSTKRDLLKCLPYGIAPSKPIASVILQDTRDRATAIFIAEANTPIEKLDALNGPRDRMSRLFATFLYKPGMADLHELPKPVPYGERIAAEKKKMFLEISPAPASRHRMVRLDRPNAVNSSQGGIRMVASVQEVVSVLDAPHEVVSEIGVPSDLSSPTRGIIYHRLSDADVRRVNGIASPKRSSTQVARAMESPSAAINQVQGSAAEVAHRAPTSSQQGGDRSTTVEIGGTAQSDLRPNAAPDHPPHVLVSESVDGGSHTVPAPPSSGATSPHQSTAGASQHV